MLKTGKFKMDQKREVIKQPRPTHEELEKGSEQKDKEEEKFFANQYWLNPLPVSDNIDDLLKEAEGF